MTSLKSSGQLTLSFEPALPERFKSLRSYLSHRVHVLPKPAGSIAADMDMSPSLLTRKLNAGIDPDDKDTQRFNCDDLESYLTQTGDAAAVIEYLAAKFLQNPEARQAAAIDRLESVIRDAMTTLQTMKAVA